MINYLDISDIITIQSRLFNSSNQDEFQFTAKELKDFIYEKQFHFSKAQDLIINWQLNEDKENIYNKQILKLLHELANLNILSDNSTISILNRYITIKQNTQITSRHLIKDLQRLKDQTLFNKQLIECIRSIEIHLYNIDIKKQLNEILIKTFENHFKEIFHNLSHTFPHDLCKKFSELLENSIKSNINEYSSNQLLTIFDSYITQIKQSHIRPSKTRHHYRSSVSIVPIVSPSLQSIQ